VCKHLHTRVLATAQVKDLSEDNSSWLDLELTNACWDKAAGIPEPPRVARATIEASSLTARRPLGCSLNSCQASLWRNSHLSKHEAGATRRFASPEYLLTCQFTARKGVFVTFRALY
jgi:hypothetical protein